MLVINTFVAQTINQIIANVHSLLLKRTLIFQTLQLPLPLKKKKALGTYDEFLKIINVMIVILIVVALWLGIIVLYNLEVMSYIERYREFATLKVVGLKDKNISLFLISQNV